jgi:hypothetical protein
MNRQPIPIKAETNLLLKCRRRCCICYGLDRDHRIKQGQIAHLDKNRDNNIIDNLAFLCLAHHDQFDSRTSQSKGFTKREVVEFRNELEDFITTNWNRKIIDPTFIKEDIFSGTYYRGDEFDSAELKITYLGDNLIHVKGSSFWGKTREYGPNIGQLDFVTDVRINKAQFSDKLHDNVYDLELIFLGNKMIVNESSFMGYFGMNVSFQGTYGKGCD